MTAVDRLDEIEARANAATDGPWEWRAAHGQYAPSVYTDVWVGYPDDDASELSLPAADADAEFIAHARTDVPALVAALRAVLDVHSETWYDGPLCTECVNLERDEPEPEFYPCATVKAITAALGVTA